MSNFEKDLKYKLNQLGDSVDCFDKILRKTSPQTSFHSEDNLYTESSVERVEEKFRFRFRFIPIFATICTVCFGFFILNPQNNFRESLSSIMLSRDLTSEYDLIKNELDYELMKFDYEYIDYTFDEYLTNALCTNPLSVYNGFEVNSIQNRNVRVYTKMYVSENNNEIPTNQIYLVEYQDEYNDDNIISIVDSKAKFEQSDFTENYDTLEYSVNWDYLIPDDFSSYYTDDIYNSLQYPFAMYYHYIYKDNANIYNLSTGGLYWFNTEKSDVTINYSLLSTYTKDDEPVLLGSEIANSTWNKQIYKVDDYRNALAYEMNYQYDFANDFVKDEEIFCVSQSKQLYTNVNNDKNLISFIIPDTLTATIDDDFSNQKDILEAEFEAELDKYQIKKTDDDKIYVSNYSFSTIQEYFTIINDSSLYMENQ